MFHGASRKIKPVIICVTMKAHSMSPANVSQWKHSLRYLVYVKIGFTNLVG